MSLSRESGSRKTSRADVIILKEGTNVMINGIDVKSYFKEERFIENALLPFKVTGQSFDVQVKVGGGGISAQSSAVRYALSKALAAMNDALRAMLRPAGLLNGDPRRVERKKIGRYKARAKFPYTRR